MTIKKESIEVGDFTDPCLFINKFKTKSHLYVIVSTMMARLIILQLDYDSLQVNLVGEVKSKMAVNCLGSLQ